MKDREQLQFLTCVQFPEILRCFSFSPFVNTVRGSFQFLIRFVQGFDPYTVPYLNLFAVAAVSDSDDIIDSGLN